MSELPVNDLISVDEAIAILDAVPIQPQVVQMPLMEAMDLHVAEDIFADRDYPPFDKAVMDGFAIRAGASTRFTVIETVAAGQMSQQSIDAAQAMAIMTGAPIPEGADAVVPIEWTTRLGDQVTLHRAVKSNHAIARRGSDTQKNQLLIAKGTPMGAAQIAVAASVGKSILQVNRAPRVSLLATGDELVGIDQNPTGSQIRNSNGPMMIALLGRLGCEVKDLGIVRDDRDAMRSAIETGLQSDALFITGGMSMGERDYVPGLLRELGLDLKISKLRIKPGKPFVFAEGRAEGRANPPMVFGLPGNPVSAFVCTLRLANRVLARLGGGHLEELTVLATLTGAMAANGPREFHIPAKLFNNRVTPLQPNGSADLFTLAVANALIIRHENAPSAAVGDGVKVISFA